MLEENWQQVYQIWILCLETPKDGIFLKKIGII